MSEFSIKSGRPRLLVNYGLILDLRESEHLGWSRVATEYIKRTGRYISKQTCKRRYEEVKLSKAVMADLGQELKTTIYLNTRFQKYLPWRRPQQIKNFKI